MSRYLPWGSLDELIALLETERDQLNLYIERLKETQDPSTESGRAAIILCRYLVEGNVRDPVNWANDLGWKTMGKKSLICYDPKHIYEWLNASEPPPHVPIELWLLCRRVYRINQKKQ